MLYSPPTVSTTELPPLPADTQYKLPPIGVGVLGSLSDLPYRNNVSGSAFAFRSKNAVS